LPPIGGRASPSRSPPDRAGNIEDRMGRREAAFLFLRASKDDDLDLNQPSSLRAIRASLPEAADSWPTQRDYRRPDSHLGSIASSLTGLARCEGRARATAM
jgi:hypothetical protein